MPSRKSWPVVAGLPILAAVLWTADLAAEQQEKPAPPASSKAVKQENGKWTDAKGAPTYNVAPDGTVDWATFSGYRRFNGNCEVCHGLDGAGSSFAPDLTQSLKTLSYDDFASVVMSGRKNVTTASNNVMPAFGTNKNVACYLDDIYTYLRARADGVQGRGRPAKHADKPKEAAASENACMG